MSLIDTGRLLLRPFEPSDLYDLYEYAQNPSVGPAAGWKPHESLRETKAVMDQVFLNRENVWAIEQKESRKLIGSIGLTKDLKRTNPGVLMLGYSIGEPYWNRGYMTEAVASVLKYAFLQLDLDMVSAYCYPFNSRSRRVIEKSGFVLEGRLRQAEQLYSGEILDDLCFSLTRPEYEALHPSFFTALPEKANN